MTINYRFSTVTAGDYWFDSCIFANLHDTSGSGGAVYVSNTGTRLLIENSEIIDCSAKTHGGAIYAKTSYVVLLKTCGRSCTGTIVTGAYGQFLHVSSLGGDTLVSYVTLIGCSCQNNRFGLIYATGGFQKISNYNSTKNNIYEYSGFDFGRSAKSLTVEFSAFVDNYEAYSICLGFWSKPNPARYLNIIRNTQGTTGYSLVFGTGIQMSDCVFLYNTNQITQKIGSVTLTNCYVSPDHSTAGVTNISPRGYSSTIDLYFYFFDNCVFIHPTPIPPPPTIPPPQTACPQSPHPTISKQRTASYISPHHKYGLIFTFSMVLSE